MIIQCRPNETVLDALLRIGYPIDYQCRDGYCGMCHKAIKGGVRYIREPLTQPKADMIVTCCTVAYTDLYIYE